MTGSRDWDDRQTLVTTLGDTAAVAIGRGRDVTVVHGCCPTGADWLADATALFLGLHVEQHPADWGRFGKSAGPQRNAEMVATGADVCLAFIRNGSRGASHCADLAEKAGIPVKRFLA